MNESHAGQVILVERHVALVGRACLLDHADRGLRRIVIEVLHPLGKRRDVVEHALDPALGQGGSDPCAPPVAGNLIGQRVGSRAVAQDVEIVHHVLEGVPLFADGEARQARLIAIEVVSVLIIAGRRTISIRLRALPFELELGCVTCERFRVEDVELLAQQVVGVLEGQDGARVEIRGKANDVHDDGVALVNPEDLVGRVILHQCHVTGRARPHVGQGIVHNAISIGCWHPVFRQFVDGFDPFVCAISRLDQSLQGIAFFIAQDIQLQEAKPSRMLDQAACQLEALALGGGWIVIEAIADVGRHTTEIGHSILEYDRGVGAGLETEVLGKGALEFQWR